MIPGVAARIIIPWSACLLFISFGPDTGTYAQSLNPNDAYCFQYTWLGPSYDNNTAVNGTCDDIENKPPICINPLVYTLDGSWPNTTAMWQDTEIRNRVVCRLTKNEVCAKWTYYYNGGVENTTHLCTKITIDGLYPMENGCVSQFKDGFTTEVCSCKTKATSGSEPLKPCNSAPSLVAPAGVLLVLLAAIWHSPSGLVSWHV